MLEYNFQPIVTPSSFASIALIIIYNYDDWREWVLIAVYYPVVSRQIQHLASPRAVLASQHAPLAVFSIHTRSSSLTITQFFQGCLIEHTENVLEQPLVDL